MYHSFSLIGVGVEKRTRPDVTFDILNVYLHALGSVHAGFWALLLLSPLLVLLRTRGDRGAWSPWAGRAAFAVVAAAGLWWAWQQTWIGDDAFISFRYARNLIEGQGLVFNPGERVEGYTNFLWTLLMAAGLAAGVGPELFSVVLGFLCFVGVLFTLQRMTSLLSARDGAATPLRLPGLAIVLAAGSYVLTSYASSGLETMFAALLMLLALEQAERERPFAAGLLGIAATLAHPDHGLFYAALGVALVIARTRGTALLRYALPFFLIFVPYFLWRWHYYGDFYPNTFYAKSADRAYFSQGGIYLLVSTLALGSWALLPLAAVGAAAHRRSLTAAFCAIGIPVYLLYTAKIGGDFMLGRLLVTPALLLILLAGLGFERLLRERRWTWALIPLALISIVPVTLIEPQAKTWFISDEASFYRLASFSPPRIASLYTLEADALQRNLLSQGLHPKLATDCVGIVGYETDLPLFDLYGLTSKEVARSPITRRRRPGHEKYGSPLQVLESGAELSKIPVFPSPYAAHTEVTLDAFRYYLTAYTPEFGAELARRGLASSPRTALERMADALPLRSADARACDVWFAREYYFAHQSDPELSARWLDGLATELPRDETEALLIEGREPTSLGYAPASGSDLLTAPFVVAGDLVTLRVGGGDPGERVRLLVDGRPVRSASGCGSEIARREVWDVREFRGRKASIEIGDERRDGGRPLRVDDVVVWAKPSAGGR
jgi:arabinofuranosyltransferase